MSLPARLVFGLLGLTCVSSALQAQSCAAFDVASIKRNTSGIGGGVSGVGARR